MRAAILVEQNQPLVVEEIKLPKSLNVGQVLVKVHYSGICGSQLGEIAGVKGPDPYLPHLLGHEGSGTVLAVGAGVKNVKPRDNVVLHWRKGFGIESEPPCYHWNNHMLNAGWVTTFNEYAIVSENRCTPVPTEKDLKVLALFGCAVTTGFGVVENNAVVRIGETVVVFGAGGIGLNVVQAASLVSAYPIIAVDLHDNRLELAAEMGASHLINNGKNDAFQKIVDIVGPCGVDCFIDNTGLPLIIEKGYRITKPQGRVTLVGVPSIANNISIHTLPLHFGKSISGSHGGDGIVFSDITRYYKLYKNGGIKLSKLITNHYPLDAINDAMGDMKNGKIAGRCLIKLS
jgi:S-(hydroxymethyl)glutathione dehydrogenase/alcohol dehydrogenase